MTPPLDTPPSGDYIGVADGGRDGSSGRESGGKGTASDHTELPHCATLHLINCLISLMFHVKQEEPDMEFEDAVQDAIAQIQEVLDKLSAAVMMNDDAPQTDSRYEDVRSSSPRSQAPEQRRVPMVEPKEGDQQGAPRKRR